MMFDFAFAGFGMFVVLGVCGLFIASESAIMEHYKIAAVAVAVMVISVAMAFGIGGALWR